MKTTSRWLLNATLGAAILFGAQLSMAGTGTANGKSAAVTQPGPQEKKSEPTKLNDVKSRKGESEKQKTEGKDDVFSEARKKVKEHDVEKAKHGDEARGRQAERLNKPKAVGEKDKSPLKSAKP